MGSFFVKSHISNPPRSLEELKQKLQDGDSSFVNKIMFYSKRSRGTDAYWRHKRAELYNWIHHHIAAGNGAVIEIIKKCRSIALRHLPRTHRIDVNWLFEVCGAPEINMRYCNTKQQIADLMVTALNSPPTWDYLIDLAQIRA